LFSGVKERPEMARIGELFIVCGFCGTKSNSKAFAETEALEAALATGYTLPCPKCGKQILCNKSNTTYALEESGGGGGIDFK
jgi:hypothetical protein